VTEDAAAARDLEVRPVRAGTVAFQSIMVSAAKAGRARDSNATTTATRGRERRTSLLRYGA
jgi:hypothetical protein